MHASGIPYFQEFSPIKDVTSHAAL
jgi:hypothetical protein